MNKKYNVLLITSDQQHFDTIGKFNPEIKTPNLDRLCNAGTYFNRAYTVNPTCTPTRATLITGKYPSQHGAWTLGTKLSEKETTIGELLQEEGIRTALVGKAHFQPLMRTEKYDSLEAYPVLHDLDFWRNFDEDFYGFDTVKLARNHTNESHVGQHYAIWMEEKGFKDWRKYFLPCSTQVEKTDGLFDLTMEQSIKYDWGIPEAYHYNAWIAEETNTLLESYKANNEQFFLWASFFDPHPTYLVPKGWEEVYDPEQLTLPHMVEGEHEDSPEIVKKSQEVSPDYSKYRKTGFALHGMESHVGKSEVEKKKDLAVYYEMVTLMDKYIGQILDKLDALGLTEETIIIFTTDHGHYMGQHGLYAKGPYMYEDAIKVPYIVSCPGTVTSNHVSEAMQSLVDIPTTILDYCGVEIPYAMTGKNQRNVWEGKEESVRDHIICEHHHERHTVNLRAYVNERYKLVIQQNEMYGQLYDLENDPGEIKNLWSVPEYAEVKEQLMMQYMWAELAKESLFMPRIANA